MESTSEAPDDSGYLTSILCQTNNNSDRNVSDIEETRDVIRETPTLSTNKVHKRKVTFKDSGYVNRVSNTSFQFKLSGINSKNIEKSDECNVVDELLASQDAHQLNVQNITVLNYSNLEDPIYNNTDENIGFKQILQKNPNQKYQLKLDINSKKCNEALSPIYETLSPNSDIGTTSLNCPSRRRSKILSKKYSSEKCNDLEEPALNHTVVNICNTPFNIFCQTNHQENTAKPYTSTPYESFIQLEKQNTSNTFEQSETKVTKDVSQEYFNYNNDIFDSGYQSGLCNNSKQSKIQDFSNLATDANFEEKLEKICFSDVRNDINSKKTNINSSNETPDLHGVIHAISNVVINSPEISFKTCIEENPENVSINNTKCNSEPSTPTKSKNCSMRSCFKMKKSYSLNDTSPRYSPYKSRYSTRIRLGTPEKNQLLYPNITSRNNKRHSLIKFNKKKQQLIKSELKKVDDDIKNQENKNNFFNMRNNIKMSKSHSEENIVDVYQKNTKLNMNKILGLKNLKKVDFIKLFLEKTSNFFLLENIYSYLDPKDLVNVYCVSKLAQISILKSDKYNNIRENYLKTRQSTKENIFEYSYGEKPSKMDNLPKSASQFTDTYKSQKTLYKRKEHILNNPSSPFHSHLKETRILNVYHPYKSKQKSPEASPSKREFLKFIKAQQYLDDGQCLIRCYRCTNPAKNDNGISVCLKKNCQYIYCLKCLRSDCISVINYNGADFENQNPYNNFFTKSPPHINTSCGIEYKENLYSNKHLYYKDESSEDTPDSEQSDRVKESDSSESNDSYQFSDRKNLCDISNKLIKPSNEHCSMYVNIVEGISSFIDESPNSRKKIVSETTGPYTDNKHIREFTSENKTNDESDQIICPKSNSIKKETMIKLNSNNKQKSEAKYKRALFAANKGVVRKLNFCSLDEKIITITKKPLVRQNSLQAQSVPELVKMKKSVSLGHKFDTIFVPSSPPKTNEVKIGSKKSKNNLRRL